MQTIKKHAEMLKLFDRVRNTGVDPGTIRIKESHKYWFVIEGRHVYVSPGTVYRHFELNTPWNFGRLG